MGNYKQLTDKSIDILYRNIGVNKSFLKYKVDETDDQIIKWLRPVLLAYKNIIQDVIPEISENDMEEISFDSILSGLAYFVTYLIKTEEYSFDVDKRFLDLLYEKLYLDHGTLGLIDDALIGFNEFDLLYRFLTFLFDIFNTHENIRVKMNYIRLGFLIRSNEENKELTEFTESLRHEMLKEPDPFNDIGKYIEFNLNTASHAKLIQDIIKNRTKWFNETVD